MHARSSKASTSEAVLPQFLLLLWPIMEPRIEQVSLWDGQLDVFFVPITVAIFVPCTHHWCHSSLWFFLSTLGFHQEQP